jgi:chemotaxis receptor (MCP) glutamine deamidase CheD
MGLGAGGEGGAGALGAAPVVVDSGLGSCVGTRLIRDSINMTSSALI